MLTISTSDVEHYADPDAEVTPMNRIILDQTLRSIDTLPEAQRKTIRLVCIDGHKYCEAAALLGIPIGTVMSRLSSARAKLKSL